MTKEELFANAKEAVFGPIPSCKMARIGRNMAISYFDTIIEDAEAVMLDMRVPHGGFDVMLLNAFNFYKDAALSAFPDETKAAIKACNDNFRSRYEPLLEELIA
jgi:hypothetical protein